MFGLTAGLHSLDPKEIRTWQATVEAGNVYLNRSITGAIVQRQPFGGWKSSCIGAGAKAGGPNYVAQFSHWQETALPHQRAMISEELRSFAQTHAADDAWLMAAMESDAYWWSHEFGIAHDPTALICEKNLFRYRAMPHAIIRASEDQSFAHTLRMVAAAERAGVKKISVSSSTLLPRIASEHVMVLNQSDEEFLQRLRKQPPHGVLRAVGASAEMHRIAHEQRLRIVARPVLALGRIEMLPFLREQSLSATAHRYGNLVPIDDMLR
jgi:RHH-type proline utilization regulon transcriptional repressor/proline dehydrogenase/delta 1-pyrroline-5-carboxylate dehydrogenase